jgi:hypothetical protein
MLIYPTKEDLEEYSRHPGISQSHLKKIANMKEDDTSTSYLMVKGNLLDCLLTNPDAFNDLFYVTEVKQPAGEIGKAFLACDPTKNFSEIKDEVFQVLRASGFQPNWKDETMWKKLEDAQYVTYFENILAAEGRTIISQDDLDLANQWASRVCSDKKIKAYFTESDNYDVYFQKPLYWTWQGVECKGLLDLLVAHKKNGKVVKYEIVDLKRTGATDIRGWVSIAKRLGYTFQMSWYYQGVVQNFFGQAFITQAVIDCSWIVVSPSYDWLIPCSHKLIENAKYGLIESQSYTLDYEYADYHYLYTHGGWIGVFNFLVGKRREGYKDEEILKMNMIYENTNGRLTEAQSDFLFL